jgi:GDPmannose 4,6-dehydratase
MLQQEKPDDYVIATGETHSVREFVCKAFEAAGLPLDFKGEGIDEVGIERRSGKVRLRVNKKYYRPAEVELLLGNPQKAERVLGWKRKVTFDDLVYRMVKSDLGNE